MSTSPRDARRRALRTAILVTGLSLSASGCERVVERVMNGRAMDGTPCVGWSLSHGSPASCCADMGGTYDPSAGCVTPPDYGIVEGPFVPPADPRENG